MNRDKALVAANTVPEPKRYDVWDANILNMARFNDIAAFNGRPFYACSNEIQHGGMLEPPHVHIKLHTGSGVSEQKFWLSPPLDTESRERVQRGETIVRKYEVSPDKNNRAKPEVQRAIMRHLDEQKVSAMHDWNNYVKQDYAQHVSYSLFPEK